MHGLQTFLQLVTITPGGLIISTSRTLLGLFQNRDVGVGIFPQREKSWQAASPPGFQRWEAKCLLCAWRSGKRHLYVSKSAAKLGIGMHLSVIHKSNLKKLRVEEREPR